METGVALNCDDKVRRADAFGVCRLYDSERSKAESTARTRRGARGPIRVESTERRDATEGATRVEEDDVDVDVRLD